MKKRFYVYQSWEEQMELLSTEEKATMLMNLFKYQRGEEPILDTTGLKLVWAGMKFLLEKDDAEYQNAVQRGKNAVLKRQSAVPQTNIVEPQTTLRHRIDNVNDNANVNGNVNVNVNVNKEMIMEMFDNGETFRTLYPKYPNHTSLLTSSWSEYINGK
jgi:hypothetical protein